MYPMNQNQSERSILQHDGIIIQSFHIFNYNLQQHYTISYLLIHCVCVCRNVTKDTTENTAESDITVNNSPTTNTAPSVTTSAANSPTKTTVSPASSPQPNNHIRR